MALRSSDPGDGTRQYRRGAVMGLTVAEAFMLLAFVLLMLMMLWRSEDAKKLAEAADFTDLTPAQRDAVLVTARELETSGLDPTDPVVAEKLANVFALGDANPPRDVLQVLAGATDAERRKLEDLIRSDEWRAQPADTVTDRITRRLEAAASSRAEVTQALRSDLGPTVARYGGAIDETGALVFPDTVLFEPGRADITPELRSFLGSICLPWLKTLEKQRAAISDLRIEGHASSEWTGANQEQAYLGNLALSQARAHAVLSTCLGLVPGEEGAWARSAATAVGYSSSRPVLVDGAEDKGKSRRVVFRVGFSDEGVLEGIRQDVGAPAPGEAGADSRADVPVGLGASPPVAALP